jgi:hypothetical protein
VKRFLTFLAVFMSSATFAQNDCVLKKESDSIKIYACPSSRSRVQVIKATFTVDVSVATLAGFIMDANNFKEWQFNTSASRVVEKRSDRDIIYYAIVHAPWPVSDRDMVSNLTGTQDLPSKVVTINAHNVTGFVEPQQNLIRVPISDAKWILTPAAGKTLVEYHLDIDPGGLVPAWMINLISTQAPFESFRNLKKKVHEKPFNNSKASFVIE